MYISTKKKYISTSYGCCIFGDLRLSMVVCNSMQEWYTKINNITTFHLKKTQQ